MKAEIVNEPGGRGGDGSEAPGRPGARRPGRTLAATIRPMPALLRWLLQLGPTNPITVRLVQGGSRRTRHLYIRTGYLAALITVLMWTLLTSATGNLNYRALAGAGAASFEATAYLQVGLICFLAPIFMAGAIAQEASPRTWDILLTTPLSAAQIVLGNLLGRLFFVLALLMASLPLFAVTQYFGGVPGRTILLSYAIAAAAALLVGSIAIALAVSRLAGRRAVFTFYVAVVSYLAITYAVDAYLRPRFGGVTPLTAANPFLALESLLNPSKYPRPDAQALAGMGAIKRFWMGSPVAAWTVTSTALSLALALLSATTVRHVGAAGWWASEGGVSPLRRLLRRQGGSGERKGRTVWHNPVAWREAAARATTGLKGAARWTFIGAGLLWGLGITVFYASGGLTHSEFRFALMATVLAELAVTCLVAMNMAGSAVSREREDGTLDLLLITPVTARQYLGGKLRGLISFLAPLLATPLLTLAFAALYVLGVQWGVFSREGGVMSADVVGVNTMQLPAVMPEAALVVPIATAPFLAFCVMVGLQWSLKSKGAISSVIATVAVVVVIGGILGLCGLQAGKSISVVGPALAALNPATAVASVIEPAVYATGTLENTRDLTALRASLLTGAVVAALVWSLVVYGMLANMVRTFDMTVRKLAGSK